MPQNEVVNLPVRPGAGHNLAEIERLAEAVARSGMFGIKTKEQALVLMAIAQAEGRHPAEAARDYSIIQGKPAKTSEAMMRDFLTAGGRVEWHELSDEVAAATFSHPQGGTIRILWDMRRAATAGLAGKDNWKKFPRAMLRSRCVSEGVRTVYPMATSGMYVPEEMRDMPAAEAPAVTAADTAAELDQFATGPIDTSSFYAPETGEIRDVLAEAREASLHGRQRFLALWKTLSDSERDSIREHLSSLETACLLADDPFGLPPLPERQPDAAPDEPLPTDRNPMWQEESYRIEPGKLAHGGSDWLPWGSLIIALAEEATQSEITKLTHDNRDHMSALRRSDGDCYRAVQDAIAKRLKEVGGEELPL